jgi:hypothetical protein
MSQGLLPVEIKAGDSGLMGDLYLQILPIVAGGYSPSKSPAFARPMAA